MDIRAGKSATLFDEYYRGFFDSLSLTGTRHPLMFLRGGERVITELPANPIPPAPAMQEQGWEQLKRTHLLVWKRMLDP